MTEVELLFTDILNCNRLALYLNKAMFLNKAKTSLISNALKRRISGEPLQYILGKAEFMGLEFKVTPDVFIPRPETEILIETAIRFVNGQWSMVNGLNILDLGTGSGCIAISLAKFLPHARITATDISSKALKIAKYNALLNNVSDKIRFIHSDLFTSYQLRVTSYDIIASNPPYISTVEIEDLQPEVKLEPRAAIDGGGDGLDFYRCISRECAPYLKKDGLLILETGFKQKDAIKNIFQKSGDFQIIDILKDYNNIDRVIVAKKWIN